MTTFDEYFSTRQSPIWISHRGLHTQFAENTISAFQAAVRHGFDAMETDLRITKDGHIVLLHDADLHRVANDSRIVSDLSRDELQKIRLRDGSQVMFFDQFVEEFAGHHWVFDIKPDTGDRVLTALAAWLKQTGRAPWLRGQSKFLCWNREHEQFLKNTLGPVSLYASQRECVRAGLAMLCGLSQLGGLQPDRTYSLPSHFMGIPLYRSKFVATLHRFDVRVLAFLPQSTNDAHKAVAAGFDEILSDLPPFKPQ